MVLGPIRARYKDGIHRAKMMLMPSVRSDWPWVWPSVALAAFPGFNLKVHKIENFLAAILEFALFLC
jgi:hypothetical protein